MSTTEPPLPPDAIDATRAARLLRLHVSSVHRWVGAGRLAGWRVGVGRRRRLFVRLADVCGCVEVVGSVGATAHAQTEQARQREWTRRVLAEFGVGRKEGRKGDRAERG